MKGFVPTPDHVVDIMVAKLFAEAPPTASSRVVDPGCGNGEFIAGVLRICAQRNWPVPTIVGIELDPARAATAKRRFGGVEQVTIRQADFLQPSRETFDYVIGNPPYVSICTSCSSSRRFASSRRPDASSSLRRKNSSTSRLRDPSGSYARCTWRNCTSWVKTRLSTGLPTHWSRRSCALRIKRERES